MAATMMVSFLSLVCLLVWFAAVWIIWLYRGQVLILMNEISHVYLQFDGLNDLKIAGEDDSKGEDEATHVDVEDIGNVHDMVLPGAHPLHPTADKSFLDLDFLTLLSIT